MAECRASVGGEGRCRIEIVGEVDIADVDELVGLVRERLDQSTTIDLDLAGVTFLDSSALGALVLILSEAVARSTPLALINVPAQVLRIFELTGLRESFAVHCAG